MTAKEFYIKKYAINHGVSMIQSTSGDVFVIMEHFAEQQNKELIETNQKLKRILTNARSQLRNKLEQNKEQIQDLKDSIELQLYKKWNTKNILEYIDDFFINE